MSMSFDSFTTISECGRGVSNVWSQLPCHTLCSRQRSAYHLINQIVAWQWRTSKRCPNFGPRTSCKCRRPTWVGLKIGLKSDIWKNCLQVAAANDAGQSAWTTLKALFVSEVWLRLTSAKPLSNNSSQSVWLLVLAVFFLVVWYMRTNVVMSTDPTHRAFCGCGVCSTTGASCAAAAESDNDSQWSQWLCKRCDHAEQDSSKEDFLVTNNVPWHLSSRHYIQLKSWYPLLLLPYCCSLFCRYSVTTILLAPLS